MPLLRVDEEVLDSHKLVVGDYEVLVRHFPSLAVFGPGTLAICSFGVCDGRGATRSNGDTCHFWLCDADGMRTFLLHLALDVRVVDDLAQGDAAEQRTQQTFPPAAAVGTVEDRHAEVTGEVGPLSKHRVLQTTIRKLNGTTCGLQKICDLYFVEMAVQPVVNDGVKVLQAAAVECIKDVSLSSGLLEPGVHLVAVLQLKQEVWHRRDNAFILRQVTETSVLHT